MGWIAFYVLLLPLIGGAAWLIVQGRRERRAWRRQLESVQEQITERERQQQSADKTQG